MELTRPTTTNNTGKKTKTRSFLPLSPIIYSYRNICLKLLNFFKPMLVTRWHITMEWCFQRKIEMMIKMITGQTLLSSGKELGGSTTATTQISMVNTSRKMQDLGQELVGTSLKTTRDLLKILRWKFCQPFSSLLSFVKNLFNCMLVLKIVLCRQLHCLANNCTHVLYHWNVLLGEIYNKSPKNSDFNDTTCVWSWTIFKIQRIYLLKIVHDSKNFTKWYSIVDLTCDMCLRQIRGTRALYIWKQFYMFYM